MKATTLFLPLLALVLAGCGVAGASQKTASGEPPPEPWTPPATKLPKAVVDEAAFLLAHGMGDPRRGEYRAASVVLGSVWGRDDKPTEIHGWVSRDGSRVVAPSGLVYTPVSVGEKADLDADVRAEVARRKGGVAQTTFPGPRNPVWNPLTVRVLLVAGWPDLAEAFHAALPHGPNPYGGAVLGRFLASAFDQAVTAHMRGDDRTALRVGRLLARVRPDFERRLLATVDPKTHVAPGGRIVEGAAFPFLDPVPALVADSERRLAEKPKPKLDPAKASVAELIDRLDEVAARQWGQPGGVNLVEDPIVAALAAKGAPAAEPLLDAVERDRRLTRSVSFGRDFFDARNLIPVRAAAYAAFTQIADTTVFDRSYGETVDVAALRRFWRENGDLSPAERWFATLKDDAAGQRRWMDAAGRLFEGANVRRNGSWTTVPKDKGPLKAEALRGRANPSLADLLARRARELCGTGTTKSSNDWFACADGLRLALDLAEWDPKAALPTLRDVSLRTEAIAVETYGYGQSLAQTALPLVDVLEARARLGDPEVWGEYAAWTPKLPGMEGGSDGMKVFLFLVHHPDRREFVGLAKRLFLAPDAPNSPYRMATEHPGWNWAEGMAVTPLLELPEFRESILRVLDDRKAIGEAWVDENGSVMVRHDNSTTGMGGEPGVKDDPLRPKPGEKRTTRVADNMAVALKRLKGAPNFQPYWPEAEKDAALARMKAFLRTNGDHVDSLLSWPQTWREPDFGP